MEDDQEYQRVVTSIYKAFGEQHFSERGHYSIQRGSTPTPNIEYVGNTLPPPAENTTYITAINPIQLGKRSIDALGDLEDRVKSELV